MTKFLKNGIVMVARSVLPLVFLCCRFVEKLLFLLPNFHGLFRSMCLEVLVSQAALYPQLYQGLKDKGFHDMLMHR